MNIAAVLDEQAQVRAQAPALIETLRGRDRVVSFRALQAASARIATQIEREGIRSGDCVLILHPMRAELYAFLIALFRIGAVGMFLDPSAGRQHVERCMRMAAPKAFFGSAKAQLLRLWIPELRRVAHSFCSAPVPGTTRISLDHDGPEMRAIALADHDAPALVTFTSGSTGEPKAALRTHGFLLAQHRALQASLHPPPGTMDLATLPVFVLANLASGVTSVIPDADMLRPGFIAPRPVLRQLQRLPIASMAASPAFVARLTAECLNTGLRIEGMERVFMGGAPVFPHDLRQAHHVFPNAEITAVYGSTEAEPMAEIALSSISDADFEAMADGRGLLAGKAVSSIDLRIMRNRWGEPIGELDCQQYGALCLGAEEVGEIVVCGGHVLSGYLNGVGETETKFRAAGKVWHRTGDLGWLDRDRRLWLLGRASAAIASAAISDERGVLYPFAVECAARQVKGIRRATILAVDGQRILVVEAAAAAIDAIRTKLAWARLDEVRMVRSIPMDKRHNAKVDYVALRRMLSRSK